MRTTTITTAVSVAVLALCLAACGGDGGGDSASSGASTATTGAAPAATTPAANEPAENTAEEGATVAPERGEASSRSIPFRGSKGPLQHLPEYGVEADSGQRGEAQALLSTYLTAAAAADWAVACANLAPETLLQIRQLAYGPGAPPPGWCAKAFPAFISATGHDVAELEQLDDLEVASFRVHGEAGFALIHGPGGRDLWVALKQRDGQWTLISPIPQPL